MSIQNNSRAALRSSLADAAFAVEERVVWGSADALRSAGDALRWPFERAAWAIERGLIWPLEERTGDWSGALRVAGVAALACLAAGAGVLGLVWASGGAGGAATQTAATAPSPAPIITRAETKAPAQAAPVLHGAAPDFRLEGVGGASKVAGGSTTTDTATASAESSATASSSSTAVAGKPAGPAAIKVAHRFAGAFVLYETGQNDARVRTAFGETATPHLARTLLRRPPRLPANAKVPRAKVLNIVPGPSHGDTYALSVSLLRLGITSELRVDMKREKKSGKWQVTEILG
jgi:hypothetical protein